MPQVTFDNSNHQVFQSIKKSVDTYFDSRQLRKTGDWRLHLKAVILIPTAIILYLYLLLAHYTPLAGILLAMLFGLNLVGIAFNVMHDACHGSYSGKKWVNACLSLTMNALGANAFIWKIKHNVIHHTYTNIDGVDDDIDNSFLIRQCPTQKWRPIHRFQFLYMFGLYAISTIIWVLGTDFIKYFSRKIYTTPIKRIPAKEHALFWVSKVLYAFFYILLPMYCVGWQTWLVGFLIVHGAMGLSLSIVFQLAHAVEKSAYYAAREGHKVIPSEWAIHEIKTTSDFAPRNKIVSWLTGGLNFQIEHHLFPQVSHVHYPALSEIVREQCAIFNLPYNYYPSMGQAIYSHVRWMKNLGKKHL